MRVQPAEDIIWRDLGDEVVILNVVSNNYFGLSGAGGQMWRHLADHGSIDRTIEALTGEFDADADTLRADLDALIRELEQRSLIEIAAEDFSDKTEGSSQSKNSRQSKAASRPRRMTPKKAAKSPTRPKSSTANKNRKRGARR
jgi:hypothetical protein